jgi:phosphate uptake regulator
MVLDFFRSGDSDTIESVEQQLVEMVRDGRVVYDAAMEALFGGGKSKATKKHVRRTDQGINEMQRVVRRELLVHVSAQPSADLPLVLSYMSIVKDAERIGDYAKNIYDLVRWGAGFVAEPDIDVLADARDKVGSLITETAEVFESRDLERAQQLIAKADDFLDVHDDCIRDAFNWEGDPSDAVARALYYRYLKRITAHLMNLMTALTMPLDQLDYYDEPAD